MKVIKIYFTLLLLLVASYLSASITVKNAQGVDIYYEINDSLNYAMVTKSPGTSYEGVINIPEAISYNGKQYAVRIIQDNAFRGCMNLTEVTIPKSITRIGGHAFKGCYGLRTVNFNAVSCASACTKQNGKILSAFEDCKTISHLNFGGDVMIIPEYAFWGCEGISEVTIPQHVKEIGGGAFIECASLTTLNFNAQECTSMSVQDKGRITPAFISTPISNLNFGPFVSIIPDYAFFGCNSLTTVTIPETVTKIGGGAFLNCKNLTSVIFNASNCRLAHSVYNDNITPSFNNPAITSVKFGRQVTNIPSYIFWGCKGITDIIFEASIENIGQGAFFGCTSLRQVTIPESVKSIGGRAFANCSNLNTIYFNAVNCVNVVTFENENPVPAFENPALTTVVFGGSVERIPDHAFSKCSALISIQIPDSIEYIGYKAFYGCKTLKEITIPKDIKSIGGLAFAGCNNLLTVNFNATHCTGVTKIENGLHLSAFQSCSSIKTVNIGEDVEIIPDYMFNGCEGLEKINIPKKIRSIGGHTFDGCINLTNVIYNAEKCEIATTVDERGQTLSAFSNDAIISLTLGNDIKEIPDYAFAYCSRLTNISLPANLERIGKYAFAGCSGIRKLTIPENVKIIGGGAFDGCSNIKDINFNAISCQSMVQRNDSGIIPVFQNVPVVRITLGPKVESLPDYAFYGCYAVENISFNKAIKTIGHLAFAGIRAMNTITLPENLTSIGGGCFMDCENLSQINYNIISCDAAFDLTPDSTLYPFCGKNKVEWIVFGKKVKTIPEGMFYGAQKITNLDIPRTITSIGGLAFANCPVLESVNFYATRCESVSNVIDGKMRSAFEGCDKLTTANFDSKMEVLPDYLFNGCKSLTRVSAIPKGVTRIGNYAFAGCEALKRMVLPTTVVAIGDGAFMETGITSFNIHEFLTEIGNGAFGGCKRLSNIMVKKQNEDFVVKGNILYTSDLRRLIVCPVGKKMSKVVVDKNCEEIDQAAFMYNTTLQDIEIPHSVSHIGAKAFIGCMAIKKVTIRSVRFPQTDGEIFSDIKKNAELKVAPGTASDYISSPYWKGFKSTSEVYK